MTESIQQAEAHLEYQREVLQYITDIGTSLRLDMDTDTLLKRVSEAACKALRFRYSVLYLSDGAGYYRACATAGVVAEEVAYLHQHPLPETVVAQLINEEFRISESYFIPGEAPLWKNDAIASFFVVVEEAQDTEDAPPDSLDELVPSGLSWRPEDMLVVPLVTGDNTLLGFLTPDAPLNGLRPTAETLALLELLANQAAIVIEGARHFEEAQRSSEERAALIEIGRALSAPDALRDLETVYQTIYEQVRRVMPADAFFVARYYTAINSLRIDYLIDEGILYPPFEYMYFPARVKKLLFEEKRGYFFSTDREYLLFISEEAPEFEDDLFGSMKPSQSLLFAPIHYGEEALGLLSAQSYTKHAYTKRHMAMLKEISVQAGIAITNARLNIELREALKRAQESERLKSHFLMTASHELRTPLTAIQGYLELLGTFGTVLGEDVKERFLNNARRACEELVLLLGNVMDTSRVDQDRVSLNPGPVQVIKAAQLVLEILEPVIARENRSVEIKIADDLYIWVDDLRVRQILLNIVGNVLKYTEAPSGIAITAECLDVQQLNRRLIAANQPEYDAVAEYFAVIAIRDWGPGIGAEDQERLFTKFMRLESALNSTQRGAGLGLFLCRQLTEAMEGRIWIESKGIPGEGSTFAVALPVYRN
jgi:signal transduction histidine kinase